MVHTSVLVCIIAGLLLLLLLLREWNEAPRLWLVHRRALFCCSLARIPWTHVGRAGVGEGSTPAPEANQCHVQERLGAQADCEAGAPKTRRCSSPRYT